MIRYCKSIPYTYILMNAKLQSAEANVDVLNSHQALHTIQSASRYFFYATEFAQLTGRAPGSASTKLALHRLAEQGWITCVARRPGKWLIIPPEHAHYGAPPVDWWIDALFRDTEPTYYVGLLSAARHWGSSHYALQETQVMLKKQRPDLSVGRQRVVFFTKTNGENTPAVFFTKGNSRYRVSTREATLVDLVRHQDKVGGLDAISRVATDFAPQLSSRVLLEALDAQGQVPCAQRLGFIFDTLSLSKYASVVEVWLDGRPKKTQPLTRSEADESGEAELSTRWLISYFPKQLRAIREAV